MTGPTPLQLTLEGIRYMRRVGQFEEASRALQAVFEREAAQLAGDALVAESLAFTAVYVGALAVLGPVIEAYKPDCGAVRTVKSTDPNLGGAQIFLWRSNGADGNEFAFHPDLFALEQDHTYTIFSRWFAFLTFACIHTRHGGSRGEGYVDVGDWSAGVGLCFCDSRPDAYLIPDSSFLSSLGYADLRSEASVRRPWAERATVAFWRGSSTGTSVDGLMSIPRVKLCQAGLDPEAEGLIDAGITTVVQAANPEEHAALEGSALIRPHVPARDFVNYKYQIDIDGNTNSWPGLFSKLLTGSPVLKVDSPGRYRQWYYDRLAPWGNFVPVAHDLSDLIPKVKFLAAHDDLARRIGEAGEALALSMTCENEVRRSSETVAGAFNAYAYRQAAQDRSA